MIHAWAPDALIPVPIHSSRLKERGFNQAELIAGELEQLMGIPMDCEALVRVVKTVPMKELDNAHRVKICKMLFKQEKKL